MSHGTHGPEPAAESARWPARVIALASMCGAAQEAESRRAALGDLWTLVHLGLARYVRFHAGRLGPVSAEDVRDIAADKTLALMRKLEAGEWSPAGCDAGQLCAFLSTLARNGLVDHLRRAAAAHPRPVASAALGEDPEPRPHEAPSRALFRILFPRALVDCLAALSPRARRIWFLRAFYDLPSKSISRDAGVRTSSAAVDMTLARVRVALRVCMRRKGFDVRELPPGTFVAVWEALEGPRSQRRRCS